MSQVIRAGSFAEGFEVGYRSIKGTSAGLPGIPGEPGTPGHMTPFLVGVRRGIEQATGKRIDEIEQ